MIQVSGAVRRIQNTKEYRPWRPTPTGFTLQLEKEFLRKSSTDSPSSDHARRFGAIDRTQKGEGDYLNKLNGRNLIPEEKRGLQGSLTLPPVASDHSSLRWFGACSYSKRSGENSPLVSPVDLI